MRRPSWAVAGLGAAIALSLAQAAQTPPLVQARLAYNSAKYDAAIAAAQEARRDPAAANAAMLVLGRAYLERFRAARTAADLVNARAALAAVKPGDLDARERIELLVGLGLTLYEDGCTDGCYSAAAEFFGQALDRAASPALADRESIFEWWASALDYQAQHGPEPERVPIYRRVLARAETERTEHADSASATYWIAAAARGVGDFERAWGAAIAAWVRASYMGPRGITLRQDIDNLVTKVILPERAKSLVPDSDPQPALVWLEQQWAELKTKYK